MDPVAMVEKLAKMAAMMGASPETVQKLKDEAAKKQSTAGSSVSVSVSTSKETPNEEDKLMEMDDKAIDAMSESDAKSFLKALRECLKKDEDGEGEEGKMNPMADKMPSLQDKLSSQKLSY